MTTLHTFGCSITQGFALPDVVKPLTVQQQLTLGRPFHWTDVHLYQASEHAWPAVLAASLSWSVRNHARRGACFQQIARQCVVAAPEIRAGDTVIVMWTYLSRISLQWPARTAVPFCNIVDPLSWRTRILPGFNKLFGLSPSPDQRADQHVHRYIHDSSKLALDPLAVYNRYHNSLVLQTVTDGFLRATGARVIHVSVEPESYLDQLERARQDLPQSLQDPYVIPDPAAWHGMTVDHQSCCVIHDATIPPAENDMHPSVQHHANFAAHLRCEYFAAQ